MSSLGVYFGPKVISIVESSGKKLLTNAQLFQSTVSTGELGEKVPTELKTIEIVALFKDEMRRNKITAKEATLCLSGKDLIIRNFDIPVLPREEIQGAINSEAKKYIPFKVEELFTDFQLEFDKINRKNLVLFMGIKKETLERYLSIANELNIKISSVEYSSFSLIRALGLAGVGSKGIVGMVCADLKEEDEVNFLVLEDGFPVFSRDISLASGPGDFDKSSEGELGASLEKLKTEIRVSLDYYHRRFPAKNIQKLFIISNPEHRSELESSAMESGLSVQFVELAKYVGKPVLFSSSFTKGYTASLSKAIKSNIKLNILAARSRIKAGKVAGPKLNIASLGKGLKINPLMVVLGIAICVGIFFFGQSQTKPLKEELAQVIGSQVKIPSVNPEASYQDLLVTESNYKAKLISLDSAVKSQLYLTRPLDIIPRVLPEGLWLTDFSFKKDKSYGELFLKGLGGLGDSDKELEAVNKFVASLKENSTFTNYFKVINVESIDRSQVGGVSMTTFAISCKTN
jgi:hypothetical protein